MILAVDPGPTHSAFVALDADGKTLLRFGKLENDQLLALLPEWNAPDAELVVEMIASYGMAVGREVFETVYWIGRFVQVWPGRADRMFRGTVKLHLCRSVRAKDGNVRQALIDRWGGKEAGVGTKRKPGQLYGVSGDVWAALAVAVTYLETRVLAAQGLSQQSTSRGVA